MPVWFDLRILWVMLALDVVTTVYALRHFAGKLQESMTATARLMAIFGAAPSLVASHLAIAGFVLVDAAEIGVRDLWFMSLWFALIVANNVRLIWQARE